MSGIEIVRITRANASLLESVAEDVFDSALDPDALADFLASPDHALIVAAADGLVVGQIRGIVHRQPDDARQLYVDNLGVAPSFQRRGAATALLRALAAWGQAQGCTLLWVATETDNAEGVGFYEALGLKPKMLVWFEAEVDSLMTRQNSP